MIDDKNSRSILLDPANLESPEPAIAGIQKKWPFLVEDEARTPRALLGYESLQEGMRNVGFLRTIIRRLWVGEEAAVKTLGEILLCTTYPGGLVSVDWKRRALTYSPHTTLHGVLYYLLEGSDRAKVCVNPDCKRPCFIGKRPNERYCSDRCFRATQRRSTPRITVPNAACCFGV